MKRKTSLILAVMVLGSIIVAPVSADKVKKVGNKNVKIHSTSSNLEMYQVGDNQPPLNAPTKIASNDITIRGPTTYPLLSPPWNYNWKQVCAWNKKGENKFTINSDTECIRGSTWTTEKPHLSPHSKPLSYSL